MKSTIASLLLAPVVAAGVLRRQDGCESGKPPAFFLSGDSTVAVDGGWGDGFLTYPREGAFGTNFGKSGATTVSFVEGGYWAELISSVEANVADYDVYVTIQVRISVSCLLRKLTNNNVVRTQ